MKNVKIFFLCAVLATGFNLISRAADSTNQTMPTVTDWTPPQNPDPQKILNEADADTQAKQYTNALAKYVWIYQNFSSGESDKQFVGVRSLRSWGQLGTVYPPARNKLKTFQDEAEENVQQGKNTVREFYNFANISDSLKENGKVIELFVWLDANKPEEAKESFHRLQDGLIQFLVHAKKYELCGKYLDADSCYKHNLQLYQIMMKQAVKENNPSFKESVDQIFINKTTTLIALLTVNNRKAEAAQIVDKISKELGIPEFKEQIDKALSGEVPESL